MNELIDSYSQLAAGHPVDSFIPGDDKQRVDLTEYYGETGQELASTMVTGSEAFNSGKLSKQLALKLKLKGAEQFDPFPSERNARAGQEGFMTTLKEGFKTFIENIIKYIRMAINWVVDTVRSALGLRKSARIEAAINNELPQLKTEFEKVMTGLGFPTGQYNLENYIGNMPQGVDRVGQILLMKSKVENDQEAIEGLGNSLPLIQQCIAKLKVNSDKVVQSSKRLKQVINEEYKRCRLRSQRPDLQTSAKDSPELNRVVKACLEVEASLDPDGLATDVGKLYETLYKVQFTNDELLTGFNTVRDQLKAHVAVERVSLGKNDVAVKLAAIQYLNKRYVEISDKEIDMSRVNWKAIGGIVDKDDATKIDEMAKFFNHPSLLQTYQDTTVAVRNFSQFCFSVSQALMVVNQQATNLIEWHGRATMYYMHGVMGDLEGLRALHLKARAEGLSPEADALGNPIGMVFIDEADAKTFGEKAAANVNLVSEISGLKDSFNSVAKQTGWSKPL